MSNPTHPHPKADTHPFTTNERDAVYKTIFKRRDVRGQFLPNSIPDAVLSRILYAAHHAPSVGFMQPWNFVVVRDPAIKARIHEGFCRANQEAVEMFPTEKQDTYRRLKLEGILEAPINLCITCDRSRTGPAVIGRTQIKTMDLYSSVCAVQNLWLAARAEGLGVGWVSIIHQKTLKAALDIPDKIVPIAYLCLGYVSHFCEAPELQTVGWLDRIPLESLVYFDQWAQQSDTEQEPLLAQIAADQAFPTRY